MLIRYTVNIYQALKTVLFAFCVTQLKPANIWIQQLVIKFLLKSWTYKSSSLMAHCQQEKTIYRLLIKGRAKVRTIVLHPCGMFIPSHGNPTKWEHSPKVQRLPRWGRGGGALPLSSAELTSISQRHRGHLPVELRLCTWPRGKAEVFCPSVILHSFVLQAITLFKQDTILLSKVDH